MKNPSDRIKVAEGSFKLANSFNQLHHLLFYYQLKVLRVDGSFSKKLLYTQLQRKTGYSISHIYKYVRELAELGWIERTSSRIEVKSYDHVWESLGINLDYNSKKKRKGTFKIFYINSSVINKLVEYVAYFELKLNRARQVQSIFSNIWKDSFFKPWVRDTEKNMVKDKEQFIDELSSLFSISYLLKKQRTDSIKKELSECYGRDEYYSSNLDYNLSTLSFAKLLGFKSCSQGYKLQQSLQSLSLIQIEARFELVDDSFTGFPGVYRDSFGRLKKRLVNKITFC